MKLASFFPTGLIKRYYSGRLVDRYEKSRKSSKRWKFENDAFREFLDKIVAHNSELVVADIPVGTNRFYQDLEASSKVCSVYGLDLSADMLREASKKPATKYQYLAHDIVTDSVPFHADLVICFRFLNLFSMTDVTKIIKHLADCCTSDMLFSVRLVDDSQHGATIEDGKVYLHGETTFYSAFEGLGLSVKEKRCFEDSKQGLYYVVWAKKTAKTDPGENSAGT